MANNRNASNSSNQQNTGSNVGSNGNGNGRRPEQITIPAEKGTPDCPVCLSRVENRAYTNTCLHEFCFPCIEEWSRNHNRCPVCREVYRSVLHNIRSNVDYDSIPVSEPLDPRNGILIIVDNTGILLTPHTGVYLIEPTPTPHGQRYNLIFLGPNQHFILNNLTPNVIITTPDNLEQVFLELGTRPHHPHHGRHPSFMNRHFHRRRNQRNEQKSRENRRTNSGH